MGNNNNNNNNNKAYRGPGGICIQKISEETLHLHCRLISRLRSPLISEELPHQSAKTERWLFFQMPDFQQQIKRQTKKQESMFHSKEEHKSTETFPEETQVLDLLDKDFKTTVLYTFKEVKENMDKELKEIKKMICET